MSDKFNFWSTLRAAPAVGDTVRRHGGMVTITGHGKTFLAPEDVGDIYSNDLADCDGELCCAVFARPATPEEIAAPQQTRTQEMRELDAADNGGYGLKGAI